MTAAGTIRSRPETLRPETLRPETLLPETLLPETLLRGTPLRGTPRRGTLRRGTLRRGARSALIFALALASCGGSDSSAVEKPLFALRPVVQPALAAATARAPKTPVTTAPADPEAVEAVLTTLESSDARMRGLAAVDAKALGDGAVAALAAVLDDASAPTERRSSAAQALGAIATPAAVDVLLDQLEVGRDAWLRAQCAWQLRAAGLDEVIPRLSHRLKYELDGTTVIWIADALASFDNLSGLDGLRVLQGSANDAAVRSDAAERMASIAAERGFTDGDALYAAWYAGDPEGRLPVREPSPALVREAWSYIARLAQWDLRSVDDGRFALVRMESWIVPLLVEALHDEDVYTRVHAAQCLERRGLRARAATTELIAALAEPRLAPQAAAALAAIGDERAGPPLEELARSARDLDLRVAATRALGSVGGESALGVLRDQWKPDQPIDLRQAAAGSLVMLGQGDAVVPFLLECLTSTTADASAAEHALGAWIDVHVRHEDAGWAEFAARWSALEPTRNAVPDAAQVAERRSARAAIAREALASVGG